MLGRIYAGLIERLGDQKIDLLADAQAFIASRRLRNALVHEYMQDAQLFLDSLIEALQVCDLLFETVDRVRAQALQLKLV